tara:strand:+ start:50 stop:742 length:693 start_codon:yes stop_codon:yes gene_type:complete
VRLTDYKWLEFAPSSDKEGCGQSLIIRRLGLQDYEPIWKSMRYIAEHPSDDWSDEIWLLSHKPVFTLGQAADRKNILEAGKIPVVDIDRGGQVTYHGPGQLVAYILLDIRKRRMSVRDLVSALENSMVSALSYFGIPAQTRPKAPGVYVNEAKIGALGLRIKNGKSYHGLSLNVDMDLAPFSKINPCGFKNLEVTQVADHIKKSKSLMRDCSEILSKKLLGELGYNAYKH